MKSFKTILLLGLYFLLTQVIFVSCSHDDYISAQKLPAKKAIMKTMVFTNDYFMKKWPDPGKAILTNIERPSNIWTRAVYHEGLMALYSVNKDQSYYDYSVLWGEKHNWGMRSGTNTRNADDQCCAQTYLDLYMIDPKPERIHDIKLSIDNMVASQKVDDWNWIDALQMAMPVFAKLGVISKDNKYFEKMYEIYMYSKEKHGDKGLYNPADGLWWRDKDFDPPYVEPNGEDCYWSRGNGWVVAALVRVMDIGGKDMPHYDEYMKTYLEMMKALVPIQRPDGYWNVSLHDPSDFGGKEVSGTSLFIYGMAWGMNNGFLDKKTYAPIVAKAWNAMTKECVTADGSLGFVQGTGKEPKAGQPVTYTSRPDFEDYGLGCFLLAGSEIYKMK